MSDDYEPALEMPTETQPAATSDEADATAAERAALEGTKAGPALADSTSQPRGQRVFSDKTRAMFKAMGEAVKKGEVKIETTDDLVPMSHEATPVSASAPTAPTTTTAPAAPAATVAPAPVPTQEQPRAAEQVRAPRVPAGASPAAIAAALLDAPPPAAAPAQSDTSALSARERQLAERERLIAEREAALVQRPATAPVAASPTPTATSRIDTPVASLESWVRDNYGITEQAELDAAVADLMTLTAVQKHGAKLPPEAQLALEGREALRRVRAVGTQTDRRLAEVAKREEEAKKTAEAARIKGEEEANARHAVGQVSRLIGGTTEYPFVSLNGDHGSGVVWSIMLEQHRRLQAAGRDDIPDWREAAKLANNYFRSQAEEHVRQADSLRSLLAPAASAPPAKPAQPSGGAPGPAPAKPAVAAPAPTPPPAAPAPADEDIVGLDRHERRARSLRQIAAKHKPFGGPAA